MTQSIIERMQLTSVTSYAEVRAVLGVSDEEIEDSTLGLPLYDVEVDIRLDEMVPQASTAYAVVAALVEADRSVDQQAYYRVYRLLCSYLFAEALFRSMPMFSYKQVTDGKAEVSRFESLETVERGLKAGINTARLRLNGLLAKLGYATSGTTRAQVFIAAATLAVNPVTNS